MKCGLGLFLLLCCGTLHLGAPVTSYLVGAEPSQESYDSFVGRWLDLSKVKPVSSSGRGLTCYKCSDYSGRCENVHECTYEDSCISLSEKGGKTIRQCIRYTDCNYSRLSQMFPAVSDFTFRCCSSNLCNSSNAVTLATTLPILTLVGLLLSVWCWI